jgi:CRISPR/Cas system-associated protein endoribonuclease Cas2
MIGPHIRAYTLQDQPALEALLQKVWASNFESHLPKRGSVTILAFAGKQLLGMMTRFERNHARVWV